LNFLDHAQDKYETLQPQNAFLAGDDTAQSFGRSELHPNPLAATHPGRLPPSQRSVSAAPLYSSGNQDLGSQMSAPETGMELLRAQTASFMVGLSVHIEGKRGECRRGFEVKGERTVLSVCDGVALYWLAFRQLDLQASLQLSNQAIKGLM